MARTAVRISFSALLRVRDDDRYVLFHSRSRPGVCGPPGGAIKYFPSADAILERLGFEPERTPSRVEVTRRDLRGRLPARSLRGLLAWFNSGAYREQAAECLRRELVEEFDEVSLSSLAHGVPELDFVPVRTVVEGPREVPGKPFRQLRRFEVFDLVTGDGVGIALAQRLMRAACAEDVPDVVCAGRADIEHGRCGTFLVAPQSAFLMGDKRFTPDLPPIL